jgi:hypothetical protein
MDPRLLPGRPGSSYLPANQLASWGLGIALATRHLAA